MFSNKPSLDIHNTKMSTKTELIHVPQQQQQQQHQHQKIQQNNETEDIFPIGTVPLETQVAGHTFQPGTNSIGLLKNQSDGLVLKPLGKPDCGAREIAFYESIKNSNDLFLKTLKNFVPTYMGTVRMMSNKRELDFIKLIDLTHGMIEPCIIDIKIGKRTWDPLATKEKIFVEQEKYAECKQNLGLCIPGFQVNLLPTNDDNYHSIKLQRFSKDYGKKLNVKTFKDTIKKFLNSQIGLCGPLIKEILKELWAIEKWSRTQNILNLYSSSILIVYDARRLTNYLIQNDYYANFKNTNGSNLQQDLKNNIPSKIHNSFKIEDLKLNSIQNGHSDENERNHQNGHDSNEINFSFGSHVKMIDFAHVFPSENGAIDSNYLFGIENLVKIFEEFLEEIKNLSK